MVNWGEITLLIGAAHNSIYNRSGHLKSSVE